ncbi:MAG: hypothetical protein KKA42_12735 [candidate division Zixibacteria bacterium]|nr:hypothetical protein [candidate division Zixibacteria bacterium]
MKSRALLIGLVLLSFTANGNELKGDRKLSLELVDVPLVSVLNTIATQNRLNLVISGEVEGTVTMRLEDVDIASALDALLTANGYNYFLRDNVIIVKPSDVNASRELESRTVRLNYLDPATAKKALDSRVSDKGSIVILDRASSDNSAGKGERYQANRIMITDYPTIADELVALVNSIDVRERSILIETRIIETKIDNSSNLGFSWPTSGSAAFGGTGSTDATGTDGATTTDGSTEGIGEYNPNNGNWTWGKLSVQQVSLILNMLEQEGNSRLVSDPRITALENHTAEFKFQTIIPIQTINRFTEGSATSDIVTFEDEEVGIALKVTPRINEDGHVTLEIDQQVEDIIGFTGPADQQKPITASRSLQTSVTVADNETVALGGLLKEDEKETINRVPILGHIPLLGRWLFTSKSVDKSTTDLLILITPHIIVP